MQTPPPGFRRGHTIGASREWSGDFLGGVFQKVVDQSLIGL
jgi:hypothetical protein